MNILVIRFRQMGDAILTTVVLNTLRRTFSSARIDFVLNKRLCRLFEGHPAIDNLIPFTEEERHSPVTYLRKVWRVMHATHYDIIIDMRSTMNTLPFTVFSLGTRYRIGLRKPYTRLVFNHRFDVCAGGECMVDHNLKMLKPLEREWKLRYTREFTLTLTKGEMDGYHDYLSQKGVDFSRPVILCGVTTKLVEKMWPEDDMVWLLQKMLDAYPKAQLIFNYAPGREHDDALRMYHRLGDNRRILIDVEAKSQRELVALAAQSTMYVGNEGGSRHIVQAVGTPSFAICSPQISIRTWIPENNVPAEAVYGSMDREEIWQRLEAFIRKCQPYAGA